MQFAKRLNSVAPSLTLKITAKAKELLAKGVDVITLAAGEPDFDTPDYIKEAAIEAIRGGFTKYTPASGTGELKAAICEKLRKENNLTYEPGQIVVSSGAKHSLYNIFQALCNEGDEVIIPSPYWLSYPEMVRLAGARPVFARTLPEESFKLTPRLLSSVLSPKTKALILNSPSNPTGTVYSENELKALARIIKEKGIFVISDEIYEKLIYDDNTHISIASLDKDIYRLSIIVNGVSKSYAMTGWRIGYLAASKEIAAAVAAIQSHSTSNPASISQKAALAALKGGQEEIHRMVAEWRRRRDYIVERMKRIKSISCFKPGGAFYLFCDISSTGMNSVEAADRLLEEVRVAVIPGRAFGWDTHLRLSFAASMDNITEALNRLEKFFTCNQKL